MSERAQRRIDLVALSPKDSLRLVGDLAAARLACFPTDTVYGVGGLLGRSVGEAVVAAKGRDPGKPLQVIFPSLELLIETVELGRKLVEVARRLLPGPFTLLVPYPSGFEYPPPGTVEVESRGLGFKRGAHSVATLGIRVPRWPDAARVMGALRFPLLASSANPSRGSDPRSLDDVDAGLRAACDLLLDGGAVDGRPSTVIDFSGYEHGRGWRILREGAFGEAQVREMLERERKDLPEP